MPLTDKGQKILTSMGKTYKDPKKAKSVFYASINAGKIKGAEGRAEGGRIPLPLRRPLGIPGEEEDEISVRQYKPQMSDKFSGAPKTMPWTGGGLPYSRSPYGSTSDPTIMKEQRLAGGGQALAPPRPSAPQNLASGLLRSSIPGRTDKLNLGVGSGSYVFPADTVSALGQGNSMAGGQIMDRLFKRGPSGANLALRGRKRAGRMFMADGGDVDVADNSNGHEPVDIVAAGGEYVLTPEEVTQIGGGDVDMGHKILDDFVLSVRKKLRQDLSKLPRPKR